MRSFFGSLRFCLIALVSAALLPVLGAMVFDGLEDRRLAITEAQGRLQRLVALLGLKNISGLIKFAIQHGLTPAE